MSFNPPTQYRHIVDKRGNLSMDGALTIYIIHLANIKQRQSGVVKCDEIFCLHL